MNGGVVATVTSYIDNGTVLFIEKHGPAPAETDWEIEYWDEPGQWQRSTCVARSIPGRNELLRAFAALHPGVRAVAVVNEARRADA